MRKKEVIKLIGASTVQNDIGDPIEEISGEREIFAEKKSIKQSEFYQAAATGLKPELTFVVWTREYNQESTLEYNSKKYNIIRTYDRDDEHTELICSGLVNGVM
jgi:SPP1 family predicted phage head-tail adaptor